MASPRLWIPRVQRTRFRWEAHVETSPNYNGIGMEMRREDGYPRRWTKRGAERVARRIAAKFNRREQS